MIVSKNDSLEDYEEEKVVTSVAILTIFITVTLAILIYYDKI